MAKSNKNNQSKFAKLLSALEIEAKKEGVNLEGLRITSDTTQITKEYCDSINKRLKCVKKPDGTKHCYCVRK
ncbi:MAG: hypothetical protein J0L86_05365 [Flavobacteriales bacterium]|nr:hypothetical protein [Flavobacteriales bacterium]